MSRSPTAIDIPFDIPQTFRLRMTDEVLGGDAHVLLDLLHASSERPPRALCFVDSSLLEADRTFFTRLERLFAAASGRVELMQPPIGIRGGEGCKNDPALVDCLLATIDRYGLDRRSYVIVFGGGALLDVVGYAAAIAHRGIRLIRLPSTTLAQADSGVGVKNAVNWFGKKNWKGTFAVPWGVINDHSLLRTLPEREFLSGFSEVVKVSLLKSKEHFSQLESDALQIATRDDLATRTAIAASVRLHLDHITREGDPFEIREARPLDFGHWSAHRLEGLSGYRIPHGEAVAIGVAIDTLYSAKVLGFPQRDLQRVLACLRRLKLPLGHPLLADEKSLLEGLEEFRQHLGGRLTVTLLKGIGQPVDVHQIELSAMREAIQEALALEQSHTSLPQQVPPREHASEQSTAG